MPGTEFHKLAKAKQSARRMLGRLRYLCESMAVRQKREGNQKMDFFDVVRLRRSVRAFADRALEEEKLRIILDSANRAPSAGNSQAYEIYVVRQPGDRKALARASLGQDYVAAAPVSLVFCARPGRSASRYGERGSRLYTLQDATIACTFAMLAATALDLATVWIGAFEDEEVQRAIRVPKDIVPVAILPIGYRGEYPAATPRRAIADLVHEI
jgi:nitroreductase